MGFLTKVGQPKDTAMPVLRKCPDRSFLSQNVCNLIYCQPNLGNLAQIYLLFLNLAFLNADAYYWG